MRKSTFFTITFLPLIELSDFAENNTSIIKDSPLDVAIIFGMDMSAKIAEHCCFLIEKNGVFILLANIF